MELTIILPTYNEEENISPLIQEIIKELSPLKIKYEILVVDDNSKDDTIKKINELKDKNIKVIIRKEDKGFARSILEGIKNAKYSYILIMNSDFGHPPKYIPEMIKNIEDNDIVIASRYIKLRKFKIIRFQDILSLPLNLFLKILLGIKATDLTCCFMIIKKEIINDLKTQEIFNGYGDLEFKLLYNLKNKIKIKEIPFQMDPRKSGTSKTRILKYGISYIKDGLKLRFSKKGS